MSTRIQLVGSLAVLGGGGVVAGAPLAGRRVRLALAALATNPDGLSSTALADRIWDDPPSTWAAALRGTILALRGALDPIGLGGQQLVQTTPSGWSLAPGVALDLLEAGVVVSAAERLLADGAAEAAIEAIAAMSSVIGGDLFAEEDAAWLDELRARLSAITDRALAVEAEAALLLGRSATAADAARRLLERNELDERAHRVLIRALATSGDRAGAIHAYETCRALLADRLGTDPGPETTAVYLDVLRSGASGNGNLPALPRNGFFGRQDELVAAAEDLSQPGVVSVLGRGGVGKTRFALHAAHAAVAELPGGRFWVSLGPISSGGLVVVTIARAVGADEGADPLASTIARLAPLGPALLVLDGCEDVADSVAELLAVLQAAAPELRILITSRRPLEVPDERKIELSPLSVPTADDTALGRSAAVQLLADRMATRGQHLALDARNAGAVLQLCARCGGVPLALELAAAQLSSMAVADLLDVLPEATRGAEDVVDSLLEQSFEALGVEAAALFTAWGAVDGALPLSLASTLASTSASPGRVARLLGELADSGLLYIDRGGPRWRYRQDDQVRRFARARLDGTDGASSVLAGMATGLRKLLPDDARTPPAGYRDAATEASDAFRTVFAAALVGTMPRQTGLELAFRLHRYWAVTSLAEGRYWLTLLLDGAEDGDWNSFALFSVGYLAYWAGDSAVAQGQLEDAARQLRGVDDGFATRSLVFAAGLADDRDLAAEALVDIRAAVELAEGLEDPNLLVTASMGVASVLAERGDAEAARYAHRALEICRERASEDQLKATLATSAMVLWQVGDLEGARAVIAEAEPMLIPGEPRIARAVLAAAAAGVALQEGRLEPAARLAELAVRDGEELGIERELPLAHALNSRIALARGRRSVAVRAALDGIACAETIDYSYPMAICLETAAELVTEPGDARMLRAVASRIRDAGDRPAPAGLRPSEVVRASASKATTETAIARARTVLEPMLPE
ncbi:MAG: BTAD domain-containing putative transcriptional regulator [Pseudolysinimonas sp.]